MFWSRPSKFEKFRTNTVRSHYRFLANANRSASRQRSIEQRRKSLLPRSRNHRPPPSARLFHEKLLLCVPVGKQMATRYDCKFIETSVIISYNVDELLVGILTQIRLKLDQPPDHHGVSRSTSMRKRSKSPLANCGPTFKKYRGSRTSTSLRVKGLLSKVWARDSKSKSCENLHVL